ncbi:hypothetical protein H0W32_01790 [Patescibacteria group bacterium]|nr:hypothetical protein [Patescibacteria group bacterium]
MKVFKITISLFLAVFAATLSIPFIASAQTNQNNYQISVSPTGTVQSGESVTVTISSPQSTGFQNDWVGLYQANEYNRANYQDFKYVTDASGTVTFTAPQTSGTYEFRYFLNSGYSDVVRSSPLTVQGTGTTPPGNGTTTPNPPPTNGNYSVQITTSGTIAPGSSINIQWSAPSGVNTNRDWIAVYRSTSGNRTYGDWEYVTSSTGALSLTVPRTPGTYEVRYLRNNGFTEVARSSQFQIGNGGGTGTTTPNPMPGNYSVNVTNTGTNFQPGSAVTVAWTAATGDNIRRDWIGLFKTGENNRRYVDWEYVSAVSGSLTLQIPARAQSGTYELRYFKNNGYTERARSSPFNVGTSTNPGNGDASIIAFGDSTVAGVGATQGNDFVSELSQAVNRPILNAGRSGDTTEKALARLDTDIISRNPDIVIVFLGGNDILQQVPQTTMFENLTTIIEEIQASGAEVILLGIHGAVFDIDFESGFRTVAQDTGARYVPNVLMGILGNPFYLADFVHPNDRGHLLIANRVFPTLQAAINAVE